MFYREVEKILQNSLGDKVAYLEKYYGIEVDVYKTERDVYTNVYGKHSGTSIEKVKTIIGILVADDFFNTGITSSGGFEEGYLYTSHTENLVGMTIKINRIDGKSRDYKVESLESVGMVTDIFKRYKIANLPD